MSYPCLLSFGFLQSRLGQSHRNCNSSGKICTYINKFALTCSHEITRGLKSGGNLQFFKLEAKKGACTNNLYCTNFSIFSPLCDEDSSKHIIQQILSRYVQFYPNNLS